MTTRIYQVDAFTLSPFSGNPAAVCLLNQPQPAAWMQQVGAEMNLSETAFLWPLDEGYSLRWFTPTAEVDICGHATLASAHTLWQSGDLDSDQTAVFHTKSGRLSCSLDQGWIEMDFPALPATAAQLPAELQANLGITPLFAGLFAPGKYMVVVDSEQTVAGINPDFSTMRAVDARAVCVTSRAAGAEVDFVSRYFAPWIGIDEDPVTGSAHCVLAPYWSAVLKKDWLNARQISARGGDLRVRPAGDRVLIRGQAVTVLEGQLL